MKRSRRIALVIALASMTFSSAALAAPLGGKQDGTPVISPNVKLSSHVYDYIEKLDGLGYLTDMRIGAKPYNRLQIARWLVQIEGAMAREAAAPTYAQGMIAELRKEFSPELALLQGSGSLPQVELKEVGLQYVHYKGESIDQNRDKSTTNSTYQPLNINNNGYDYGKGSNGVLTLTAEGYLNRHTLFSVTPRVAYSSDDSYVSLESAYMKTHINNLEILVGKNELWWGQGYRGSLAFTNNAPPQTSLRLSAAKPVQAGGVFKFLGQVQPSFFYSVLDANRKDVPYPSLVGMRTDFTPSENFTFALARTSIVGGKNRSLGGFNDYKNFLFAVNATTAADEKWNSIAGLDFRWRIPHMNGLQVYGEVYGEDNTGNKYLPAPSKRFYVGGVYIPRLTNDGSWDLRLEGGKTDKYTYVHSQYTEGYSHLGHILGDAIGNRATRYYGQLTHYHQSGLQLGFHVEQLKMNEDTSSLQKVNSYWLSARKKVNDQLAITASAGMAKLSGNETGTNYLMSLGMTHTF